MVRKRLVTTDSELLDAVALAPTANDQKLLRLYIVPRGATPSLMASTAAKPSAPAANVLDVDLTSFLSSLGGAGNGNASDPITSLLSLLSSRSSQSQAQSEASSPSVGSNPSSACPFLAGSPTYICDACNASPIEGTIHQCDSCPDFHLCDPCRFRGAHSEKNHTFTMNPTRPNAATRCHRWNRRPHHGSWNPHGSPASTNNEAPASNPSSNPSSAPASPFAAPQPSEMPLKKPITVIPAPVLPIQPLKPQIVETTPNSSPIVPPAQLVPSEKLEMAFLSDVTIPDGTEIVAGEGFSKVWRLSNCGTTTWPLGCRLALESNTGDRLSTVEYVEIPGEVPPQSAVTISVEMEAPKKLGRHVSYWRMHGPSGSSFGARIWVDIVSGEKKVVAVPVPAVPVSPVAPAAVPEPAAAGIKPGEKYATQLESLYRMGFLNLDLNRNLLDHNKGNIAAVIDQLFTFSQH